MTPLRRHFIDELRNHLRAQAAQARRAEAEAVESARTLATEKEKKEDARAMQEFGSLATAHARRTRKALDQLDALEALVKRGIPDFNSRTPADIGAIVDVLTRDEQGELGRTFILLPVGGATELSGPGGDGFITVITPSSPVGRALMGRRAGEVIDVAVNDDAAPPREWEILEIC